MVSFVILVATAGGGDDEPAAGDSGSAEATTASVEENETNVENKEPANSEATEQDEPVEEKVEEKPKWPDVEITEENIEAALADANGLKTVQLNDETLRDIKIIDHAGTEQEGDKIIEVHVYPTSIWNEQDYAEQISFTIVGYSEVLFKHPNVSAVRVWGLTTFTDQYGNEEENTAVRIEWTREAADKINYENYYDMVLTDYKGPFQIASNYFIHPAIYKNLKDKTGLGLSGGDQ